MGADCCGSNVKFDGLSADYKRRLWLVIAINAAMFAVEMGAGALAGSQALQADALDFAADATTYGISLAVIGASVRVRSTAAIAKAASLTLMGLWVLGATAYQTLAVGVPRADVMGIVGILALVANLASVFILVRYKDGDANVRSVVDVLAQRCDRQCRGHAGGGGGMGDGNEMAGFNRRSVDGRLVSVFVDLNPAAVIRLKFVRGGSRRRRGHDHAHGHGHSH